MNLAKLSEQAARTNPVADGFSKAVEFVLTPGAFGVGGYFADRWLGTAPILMFVLFFWALAVTVGMTIRDYKDRMRAEQDRLMGRTAPQLRGTQ